MSAAVLATGALTVGVAAPTLAATPPTSGTLVGTFEHIATAKRPHGEEHRGQRSAAKAQPLTHVVILTSPSGHQRRIRASRSGHFFARLPVGSYRICDRLGAVRCDSTSCPVFIIGTRFGPAGESPPVTSITILPGVRTHLKIDCGR